MALFHCLTLLHQLLHDLKCEIEAFSLPRDARVKQSKILIIGPVGAGKSSFFNTVASVFRGYVSTDQAASGSAEQSITSQVRCTGLECYFLQ